MTPRRCVACTRFVRNGEDACYDHDERITGFSIAAKADADASGALRKFRNELGLPLHEITEENFFDYATSVFDFIAQEATEVWVREIASHMYDIGP